MKRFLFTIFLSVILLFHECDNIEAVDKEKEKINNPVIVLTFDDASITHYTYAAPLLSKYGFGATFFICEFPLEVPADSSKYMSWDQITELNQMGFEIGNHTRTHKHVNQMSKQEMYEQLGYIEAKCKEYGIQKPISFAYPGYDTSNIALEVLNEMGYKYARVGGNRKYNPLNDNPLLIPSFSTTGINNEAQHRVMNILKSAKAGDIIVFTVHGIPDYAHPWVTTSPELFKSYVEYMHDHNFIVIALRDLEKYLN
ncbi:polysaccharide deacetylase family protein [Melioribacter sp. Ez-97]|uniref:polysaccharide deacetylase family protein n=1 Tax=Melioribacter sp. Ez-97 TaxID=3423434 RepID=UPI003ED9B85E